MSVICTIVLLSHVRAHIAQVKHTDERAASPESESICAVVNVSQSIPSSSSSISALVADRLVGMRRSGVFGVSICIGVPGAGVAGDLSPVCSDMRAPWNDLCRVVDLSKTCRFATAMICVALNVAPAKGCRQCAKTAMRECVDTAV